MVKRWLCVWLFILLSPAARASFETAVTVMQPLETDGAGDIISAVTYIGHSIDRHNPACEALLTVQPNVIWCDGKAQDRNSASAAGITFQQCPGVQPQWESSPTDTLCLRVDLSNLGAPDPFERRRVTTTLMCGLRNARVHWPIVRYVRYMIHGAERFEGLGGVYSLEHVVPPEPPRQLSGPPLESFRAEDDR